METPTTRPIHLASIRSREQEAETASMARRIITNAQEVETLLDVTCLETYRI